MSTLVRVTGKQPISAKGIRLWLDASKRLTNFKDYSVSCRVTTARGISRLNKSYRGKAGPTDCLSFSAMTWDAPERPSATDKDAFGELRDLGDVVLCASVIEEDALRLGSDREAHWRLILTHAYVHLLGHDHETEEQAARMEPRVEELVQSLNALSLPLLTRDLQ